jgi:hypothetical protein
MSKTVSGDLPGALEAPRKRYYCKELLQQQSGMQHTAKLIDNLHDAQASCAVHKQNQGLKSCNTTWHVHF